MALKRGWATDRLNAHDRGYTRRWKRQSREFLRRHRWCVGCLGIGIWRRAEVVDHVIPHGGDQRRFWDSTNWQALCAWHHNSIKPELERLHAQGKASISELDLRSRRAVELTREKHRPAVGADGWAIEGS